MSSLHFIVAPELGGGTEARACLQRIGIAAKDRESLKSIKIESKGSGFPPAVGGCPYEPLVLTLAITLVSSRVAVGIIRAVTPIITEYLKAKTSRKIEVEVDGCRIVWSGEHAEMKQMLAALEQTNQLTDTPTTPEAEKVVAGAKRERERKDQMGASSEGGAVRGLDEEERG